MLFDPHVGREYRVGFAAKLILIWKIRKASRNPGSATNFFEQLYIVKELLQIASHREGAVAEFGCYKGLSTASLSLVCALTKRRLLIFDSFEGLPDPEGAVHHFQDEAAVVYTRGQYTGTLDEVKANVKQFGDISVCEFVSGYFENTLSRRSPTEKFVLIFEDADLPQSVRSVLCGAWKKLQPEGIFFCHEARDREIVDLFFDHSWWIQNIGEAAPGFVGSGGGMMSGPGLDCCSLGFAVRRAA